MLRNQEWRHSPLSLCNGTNAAKKTSFSSVDASARLLSLRTIRRVFLANRSKILPHKMGRVEPSVLYLSCDPRTSLIISPSTLGVCGELPGAGRPVRPFFFKG